MEILRIVFECFAFLYAILVMLPMGYICGFLMEHMILTYILLGALIMWTVWICRYECKIGDIKMRDNEIPADKVDFKCSNFIFELE
jgi:hypothetical protein